ALLGREPARARQETTPVLAEDLEAAGGPAVALLLVGLERVGEEAVAVAPVGVMREPALFQDGEAEIGVLADRIAGPAASLHERGAAHQAHGAMHDDRVGLVPLHHYDVEAAGIFAVHRRVHWAALAVTMILRRLDQAHFGIAELRYQILEPVGVDRIVGVDDADDLRVRRGVSERESQRTGLVALKQ